MEPSRTEQLCCALVVMRRLTRAVLALALLGVAFSGVLTYRELASSAPGAASASGVVVPGGGSLGLSCIYNLVTYVLIAALSAYALARTRVGLGDEVMS